MPEKGPSDSSIDGRNALDATDLTSVYLSPQERTTLCNDIYRFSLLIGREVQSDGGESLAADTDSRAESSPWERLQLLAALWPRLEAALQSIAASPDIATAPTVRSLPIQTARGSAATLARLARNPADHRAWIQEARQPERTTPVHIQEQRATHTMQTAANRIAKRFLTELAQEIQALYRLSQFCEELHAVTVASGMAQSIRHWIQRSPFSECIPRTRNGTALSTEPLQRCSPAYHSLSAVIHQSRSGLHLDWTESAILRFPALEAWHLYEIWCFLQVGAALRALGWRPYETDCLQIVQTGMCLRLAHGKASRIRFHAPAALKTSDRGDAALELVYQPLFSSANRSSARLVSGYSSLSHVMQPDIALVRNGRLLVLDPKYRSYGEWGGEQEDIDKMHTYRDAIVHTNADTGQTVPAVDAAWCLFPGGPVSPHSRPNRLRAYPASTADRPFGTAGIGAVQVRPGADNVELTALLRHWLHALA